MAFKTRPSCPLHPETPLSTGVIELLGKDKKEPKQSFPDKPIAFAHEYYLTNFLDDPYKYTAWFDKIRHADPVDTVKIYVNCEGGNLWTAIEFMKAIRESQCEVTVAVEGACLSAATMLMLAADSVTVAAHSVFMFHNYSGGVGGKGGEMADQIGHYKKWSEKLLRDVYEGFLSKAEIRTMLDNKDIWMSGDDVIARLKKREIIRSKSKRSSK